MNIKLPEFDKERPLAIFDLHNGTPEYIFGLLKKVSDDKDNQLAVIAGSMDIFISEVLPQLTEVQQKEFEIIKPRITILPNLF